MAGYGRNIRTARRARDLSQEALAKLVGVRTAAVSDWEREVYRPTEENLTALAGALGVTVPELRDGPTQPAPAAETATGAGLTEFQRGVLYAARAMSQRVTDLLDEALGAAAGPYRPPMIGNGGVLSPRPGEEARRAAGE